MSPLALGIICSAVGFIVKALASKPAQKLAATAGTAAVGAVVKHGPDVAKKTGRWIQTRGTERPLTKGGQKSQQERTVKAYLDALSVGEGSKFEERLEATTGSVERLHLIQLRLDVQKGTGRLNQAEAGFVEVAKPYSDRNGISYQAWRKVGVPQEVLQASGIRPEGEQHEGPSGVDNSPGQC